MSRLDLQRQLIAILAEEGLVATGQVPKARHFVYPPAFRHAVIRPVYQALGGVLKEAPLRPGDWDLEFNGIAVELDEALHFNRYRTQTLRSAVYLGLPGFPRREYQEYCIEHEKECIQAGSYLGKWTNESTARQFGEASDPGEHTGNGPTRWKQRALYDFIKDSIPLVSEIRVARISVWDVVATSVGGLKIVDLLRKPPDDAATVLRDLIERRSAKPRKNVPAKGPQ